MGILSRNFEKKWQIKTGLERGISILKFFKQSVFDKWPMQDKSVQAIITSPPYWGLRKYDIPDVIIGDNSTRGNTTKGCVHELGQEIIKGEGYTNIGKRWNHGKKRSDTAEAWDQEVSGGSFCLKCNAWKGQYGLEPSYKQYIEHTRLWVKEAWRVLRDDGLMFLNLGDSYSGSCNGSNDYRGRKSDITNLPSKCKILIPHRVAISLIDDGWILRNDIVWFKPNSMPESCQDRFSKKFEYIFMFSKKTKYFFDMDAVREKHKAESLAREQRGDNLEARTGNRIGKSNKRHIKPFGVMPGEQKCNPLGKNPGDMWSINPQPSPFKHYAMWPEKLVKRMVMCASRPKDSILDPFCGSGTTLRIAESLKRSGIGIDLGYEDIQSKRLKNIQEEMYI